MGTIIQSEIQAGVIYGDRLNDEYVYMPASELGVIRPLCVYEHDGQREDVSLARALQLIRLRSLRPVEHPRLGRSSC